MLSRLPHPQQLAALGAVLCLSRADADSALAGWTQAVHATYGCDLDSDGLRECIRFFDARGTCCWRLYLLPDADFLAWEQLASGLPRVLDDSALPGLAERLWRHLARRLNEPCWRACALRFHVHDAGTMMAGLGASLPVLSTVGREQVRRIVRCEGVDGSGSQRHRTHAQRASAHPNVIFFSEREYP